MSMDIQRAIDTLNHLVFCGSCTTGPCKDCDRKNAKDTAIQGLQELQQYRQIGTVDECMGAREKQIPKEPDLIEVKQQGLVGDGTHTSEVSYQSDAYECPKCGSFLGFKADCCDDEHYQDSFCCACGQALRWGD